MTLSEQLHRNRQSARDRALDDDWVMPFSLWCEVNNFSPATGRRLRKAGKGPVFTQISDRRIGVTVRNNRAWQESRAKSDDAEPRKAACRPQG
jgi:hypothetical protein